MDSELWFKAQPIAEHKLSKIMTTMAAQASFVDKKTNTSARKATCTRLLHSGIAPNTIAQLSGHRNVQSVNNYAVASVDMQKNKSHILCMSTTSESSSSECVRNGIKPQQPPE
ncbi:hypothetical protein KUTeg_012138 [Tegillarca granosa]|uniref:Tyr recombinase domain-containing protein n=1 Tax=Tegillarca granosa TaxID=220873 RepID=A0ABQ9F3W1_TEGGR|nr:hypothetical protein KUTeg_012138 [Tegillarca granosa]